MKKKFTLLLLFTGCSEYDLKANQDVNQDVEDDCPEGETCDEQDSPIIDSPSPEDSAEPLECVERVHGELDVLIDDTCQVLPQIGTFNPVTKWSKPNWSVDSGYYNIMMTPIVVPLNDDDGDGDVDRDDYADIVVLTYSGSGGSNGVLRAVSGIDGTELWTANNPHQITGAIAGGDIDNDGLIEIIAPASNTLYAYENDGSLKWISAPLGGHMYGTSDAPAIADLNGDGSPEIIAGRAILNNQGTVIATGSFGMGVPVSNVGATPSVADLDQDGQQEVIVGNAYYNFDGSAKCSNSNNDGYTAVADFDLDGMGEVIVSSGNGEIRLQETDCTIVWSSNIPGANSSGYGGPPTIADYDGDGLPEVGVAANSSYTVFDTDGVVLWQQTTQDYSSGNTGSAVFDFEGDGIAEAIYPDELHLWAFNGPDGAVKLNSPEHSSNTWTEYAVIADLDNDNHAEIIVPNNDTVSGGFYTGITVLTDADNSWQAGTRIWNQHAYSITNINEDGTIPTNPQANWLVYNNFRSGDLAAATGGLQSDLLVNIRDVCRDECEAGRFYAWVSIANQGTFDIETPVDLVLQGQRADGSMEVLDQVVITDPVPAGKMLASVKFSIEREDVADFVELIAVVDGVQSGDGAILECDELNNQALWGDNICNY